MCFLCQTIFRHMTEHQFIVQTAKETKKKAKTFLSERFNCDPIAFEALFAEPFRFVNQQHCEDN